MNKDCWPSMASCRKAYRNSELRKRLEAAERANAEVRNQQRESEQSPEEKEEMK